MYVTAVGSYKEYQKRAAIYGSDKTASVSVDTAA
jgi:hypothetical protein